MGDCLVVLSLFMVMRRCGELGVLCVCCCVLGMFGVVVLYYFCYIGEQVGVCFDCVVQWCIEEWGCYVGKYVQCSGVDVDWLFVIEVVVSVQ